MTTVTEAAPVRTPQPRGGFGQSVRDSLVVAKRNLIRMMRIPEVVIFGLIQPIMFVVLFSYVFGGSINIPGAPVGDAQAYRDFLMAGIFAQTVTFATAGAGAGIADDMHKGLIDRFRSLPMSRGAVLTGRTLADLVQTALTLVVLAVVALLDRLAHPRERGRGARRLRAAAPARLRLLLDRRADRPDGAHPRGGHLGRPDLALPADVHLQRLRAGQRHAGVPAARRGVEPVQRDGAGRAGSCSATRGFRRP